MRHTHQETKTDRHIETQRYIHNEKGGQRKKDTKTNNREIDIERQKERVGRMMERVVADRQRHRQTET